ncbi:MAG: anthranilate synthase component II [Flavobacteriales bacterium]
MSILVIDNYDSFTYNLVHYLEQSCEDEIAVKRNDEITLDEVNDFDQVVISPGPGLPQEAGITVPLVQRYFSSKKILGVCLGHQAMTVAFGGTLKNLVQVHHGIARNTMLKENDLLFDGLPPSFLTARYHSWAVDERTLPDGFVITATDENGETMAMKHNQYNLRSVQFHPESVLTEHGLLMIQNWVQRL